MEKMQCKDLLDAETTKFLFSQQLNNIDKAIEVAEKEKPYMLPALREFKKLNTAYYQEAKEVFEAYQNLSGICI